MELDRKPRGDFPGAWHHVMNRGIASRPAFEGRSDVRTFLALLAWKVHERQIEVHAFAILTTHFHLLLRSLVGELSNALMWIENQYVKRFNRLRERDGSLFRSRFRSRIVDSESYWFNVIRYIDANPVDAGLCARSAEYEFGSARMYCGGRSAPWLERQSVEKTVMRARRTKRFAPADYESLFGTRLDPDDRWLLERRMERGGPNLRGQERGNELLEAAPAHVLEWLRRRAELADGGSLGLVLTAPGRVERLVRQSVPPDDPALRSLEAGLLRELCGLTLDEIAARMWISASAAWKLCRRHRQLLLKDTQHAEFVTRCVEGLQRERVPSPLRVENPGGLESQPVLQRVGNSGGLDS